MLRESELHKAAIFHL